MATELEEAATRARRRGAIAVAVAALERAAKLSEAPGSRGRRLLRSAELAFELGRHDLVVRLLREAEPLELGPVERARLAWIREIFDDGVPGDATRVHSLVEMADQRRLNGDTDLALDLLRAAALRCWWADPGEEERARVVAAAERLDVDVADPRLLSVLGIADPIGRGAVVIERIARIVPDEARDPHTMRLLGGATFLGSAFDLSAGFLAASVAGLRAQGRLGLLAQALVLRAWTAIHLGSWKVAMSAAEEARRLARETAQPAWAAPAQIAEAMLAGLRGEQDVAYALAAEVERVVLPTRASAQLAGVQLARGLTALSSGHYAEAFEHLQRMFASADPAFHSVHRWWAIGYLAEAALYSGWRDEARAIVAELEPLAEQTPAQGLHVAMRYAHAVLADDKDAEALFQAAFNADLTRWPFDRARLQLAYGVWLRRGRHVAESRAPLRAARDAFDALGTVPWGERARQELRAAGESSRHRTPDVVDQLTPQELQIAQMAADGLSNREIGQQLYLSHRTVGSHLYRVFPKLGITSRAELRSALGVHLPSPV